MIPRLLVRVTEWVKDEFKIEANPFVSIRLSLLVSALLVALSYALVQRDPAVSGAGRLGRGLPASLALPLLHRALRHGQQEDGTEPGGRPPHHRERALPLHDGADAAACPS